MVLGEAFTDRTKFFGPGIVEAYNNEKLSLYPRIIIEEDLMNIVLNGSSKIFDNEKCGILQKLLFKQGHVTTEEQKYIKGLLIKDKDGRYFANYLYVYLDELEQSPDYLDLLTVHKQLIVKNLKIFKNEREIRKKYFWLKRYHNSVIKRIHAKYFHHYLVKKKDYYI
ncbi:MAG: hypothetical protein HPY53_00770 [Brevinematales bacterium]|nr:hypothetical protein [Brevinematales bacterium]